MKIKKFNESLDFAYIGETGDKYDFIMNELENKKFSKETIATIYDILKKANTNNDISEGDIVLANTYTGGKDGFQDLKYKVKKIYYEHMDNAWMADLEGIDWVGHNISYRISRLKKA